MSGDIAFAVCRHYYQEAEHARLTEQLDQVVVFPFPSRCGRPRISLDELTALLPASGEISQIEVFGGSCLQGLADCSIHGLTIHIHQLELCFCLVAEASLVTRCIVTICELPIENARRYGKIVRAEKRLKKANETLYQISTVDALTGIANRRAYNECMEREWKTMLRNQSPLSLILVDIDFFKDYNDCYGHKAGDDCLRRVAHLIRQAAARPGDFVARYGGEEFAVILADTGAEGALHVAEKIRRTIVKQQIAHQTSTVIPYITISLGIGMIEPPHTAGQTSEMLFRAADTALYEAKKQGRNRSILSILEPIES